MVVVTAEDECAACAFEHAKCVLAGGDACTRQGVAAAKSHIVPIKMQHEALQYALHIVL